MGGGGVAKGMLAPSKIIGGPAPPPPCPPLPPLPTPMNGRPGALSAKFKENNFDL